MGGLTSAGGAAELTTAQQEQLLNALLSAFPNLNALSEMVYFGFGESLAMHTGYSNRRYATFDLIRWAIAQGRIEELILAARERVPRSPELRAFAEGLVLAPPIIAPPEPNAPPAARPTPVLDKAALEKVV